MPKKKRITAGTQKRKDKKKKAVKKSKPTIKKSPKKEKVIVIGTVTHYFPKVNAAVVKLKRPLSIGDKVIIKGTTTQFEQKIESMQIDHIAISKAKKGNEIGLEVRDRVREHDQLIAP